MNLSNVHFDHELERSETVDNVARKIEPILEKEFRRFFLLGMAEVNRDVKNSLDTLQANAKNNRLSDAEFRQLAVSIIEIMQEAVE